MGHKALLSIFLWTELVWYGLTAKVGRTSSYVSLGERAEIGLGEPVAYFFFLSETPKTKKYKKMIYLFGNLRVPLI